MKQLVTYFALSYLISWIFWLPLYEHVFGLANMAVLPFHFAIGGLGPSFASLLTTGIFLRKEGLKQLLRKCLQFKPLLYLLIALFSPFLLAALASSIDYIINRTPIDLSGLLRIKEFPKFNLLTFFIYNIIFFGFGEEIGWRGFALPRLQAKMNALTASTVLTFFWALWHLPLFFFRPGYTTMDVAGVIGWVLSLLTGSILLTWFFNSSRSGILICAVFHSTVDIAFTADFADKNIVNYMGFLITAWGVLTIVIFGPKNLARNSREKVPGIRTVSASR